MTKAPCVAADPIDGAASISTSCRLRPRACLYANSPTVALGLSSDVHYRDQQLTIADGNACATRRAGRQMAKQSIDFRFSIGSMCTYLAAIIVAGLSIMMRQAATRSVRTIQLLPTCRASLEYSVHR